VQYLSYDDVIAFYEQAIGPPNLRYPDGLAAAVARPQASAFGSDAYPTIHLKAAALMQSLAQNQPFVDGNKRISWICGKVFLQLHDLTMNATDEAARVLFVDGVACGMSIESVAEWIGRHVSYFGAPPPNV